DIKDGTLSISTGSLLTGSGSFSANQGSNESIDIDLTQATKDKINNGVQDLQSVTDKGNNTTNNIVVNNGSIINKSIISNSTSDPGILVTTNINKNTTSSTKRITIEFEVPTQYAYNGINKLSVSLNNYNS